jgi:hypothetical protein
MGASGKFHIAVIDCFGMFQDVKKVGKGPL